MLVKLKQKKNNKYHTITAVKSQPFRTLWKKFRNRKQEGTHILILFNFCIVRLGKQVEI